MNDENKSNKQHKAVDFQKYLATQLKNPRFKKYYDKYGKQLEIVSALKRDLKVEFVK